MDLEEFEIDGKKVYISNKSTEGETGVAYFVEDDNIEKTQEIKVLNEEDINGDTLTNIFGEENE